MIHVLASIANETHPHHGPTLPVLNQANRRGTPTLLQLLPNGSRRFIPLAWTDAAPRAPTPPASVGTRRSPSRTIHSRFASAMGAPGCRRADDLPRAALRGTAHSGQNSGFIGVKTRVGADPR